MVPPQLVSPAVQVGGDGAAPALSAVATIAASIASAVPLDEKIVSALENAAELLALDGATVWLQGARVLRRAWSVRHDGEHPPTADEVERWLDAPDAAEHGVIAYRLQSAGHVVGALTLRLSRPLGDHERTFAGIVADLLGPELSHVAHSHLLEAEVEHRARQFDDQRAFTEKVIDSLPVGLYVIDREYRIQIWNRKRETGMQGVSREEAIGRTIFEILHRQPAETLRREFDEVFQTGRVQVFHMESHATGEVRTYRISKIPMRLGDGAVTHVITIGEDVTDWKDAQERIAQAEKLAAIGQLAAGVMHEINNPLATIAACAESFALRLDDMRAGGTVVPSDAPELLGIIDGEVQRCKRIIDGLLDFSRPKSAARGATDVNEVLEQTLFLLKHHARFKKLQVDVSLAPALPLVHANREQLIQVFMALLLNAVDAMHGDGTVAIRTRAGRSPREGVVAEIIDHGVGIARGEAARIFEPFYTTKPPGRGTGLGLSICYGIIADHHGEIEVESTPGTGSTFRVSLPAEEAA